ncbi:ribbon-helix-helix domain-containing protein [Methylobacterium sp. 1030]|uniref:ribbon-helix-helix domain-containing protein n=1 Tax=Methylobacterium sp. 1030 TaxID=3156404 RepID=UPI0033937FB2
MEVTKGLFATHIDVTLRRRVKFLSVMTGKTIEALATEALTDLLKKHEDKNQGTDVQSN